MMMLHTLGHWVTVAANADRLAYMDSLRLHQLLTPYKITQLLQLTRQLKRKLLILTRLSTTRCLLPHNQPSIHFKTFPLIPCTA